MNLTFIFLLFLCHSCLSAPKRKGDSGMHAKAKNAKACWIRLSEISTLYPGLNSRKAVHAHLNLDDTDRLRDRYFIEFEKSEHCTADAIKNYVFAVVDSSSLQTVEAGSIIYHRFVNVRAQDSNFPFIDDSDRSMTDMDKPPNAISNHVDRNGHNLFLEDRNGFGRAGIFRQKQSIADVLKGPVFILLFNCPNDKIKNEVHETFSLVRPERKSRNKYKGIQPIRKDSPYITNVLSHLVDHIVVARRYDEIVQSTLLHVFEENGVTLNYIALDTWPGKTSDIPHFYSISRCVEADSEIEEWKLTPQSRGAMNLCKHAKSRELISISDPTTTRITIPSKHRYRFPDFDNLYSLNFNTNSAPKGAICSARPDIPVTHVSKSPVSQFYHPLTEEDQRRIIDESMNWNRQLSLLKPHSSTAPIRKTLTKTVSLGTVPADGNCLFSSLSWWITGSAIQNEIMRAQQQRHLRLEEISPRPLAPRRLSANTGNYEYKRPRIDEPSPIPPGPRRLTANHGHHEQIQSRFIEQSSRPLAPLPHSTNTGLYACDDDRCPVVCNTRAQLEQHHKRHQLPSRFRCDLCTYKTAFYMDLVSHLNLHSKH